MKTLMKNDVFWNALGSLTYALASMVLAFSVIRLAGPRDGGIFGFGFSTLGQQLFILGYFGIRPFHITDMRGEYSFGEYLKTRQITCALAVLFGVLYLYALTVSGSYDIHRSRILLLLCFYKIVDAYADVYESELQRQGKLYLTGQSLFFRTVLSVCVLLGSLLLWNDLLLSCRLALLSQIFGCLFFAIRPLMSCGKDQRSRKDERCDGIQGVNADKAKGKSRRLLQSTSLLFLSVFLDFYVFSASKYAVDQVMGSEVSGLFNILFMPTSFIYLLANFLIRPMLTKLAEDFKEGRKDAFISTCRFMFIAVTAMGLVISFMSLLLGRWGLGIFEFLLGNRYDGLMKREYFNFFLLILGGGLYALCNVQYYVLVTLRRQKEIFLSYLTASIIALLSARRMVQVYGISGGAWNYVILMTLLLIIFTIWVGISFRKMKQIDYGNEDRRGEKV